MVDVPYLRLFEHRTTRRRIIERICLIRPLYWRKGMINEDNPNGESYWDYVEFIPYEKHQINECVDKLVETLKNPPICNFHIDRGMMKMGVGEVNAELGSKLSHVEDRIPYDWRARRRNHFAQNDLARAHN